MVDLLALALGAMVVGAVFAVAALYVAAVVWSAWRAYWR